MKSIVYLDGPCPVCAGNATAHVADFPLKRADTTSITPLYHCLLCQSAHFRHDPADSSSLNWHVKIKDRNLVWSEQLFLALQNIRSFSSVIDIGSGIGTWIYSLKGRGVKVLGFEPGADAAIYGQKHLAVPIHQGYFHADEALSRYGRFDLISCIMVLEHLRAPRDLVSEISKYCCSAGAAVYVSVPFYYGADQLNFDDESETYSVFNEVSAHVTYFSESGLKRVFADFGMACSTGKVVTKSNVWSGFLFVPRDTHIVRTDNELSSGSSHL